MSKKSWIHEPLRISAKQCNFNEDSDEIFRTFTVDFGFNVEQLNHIFKKGFQGEFIEEKHGKILDGYVKRAHEAGVREIVYFCLHELFESDRAEHPDWVQTYRNGEPINIYGTHYCGCPNSSWRDYSIKRIGELASHDIDGIFFDGPAYMQGGCYCGACKKKFKKQYGKELDNATYYEYIQFRKDSITEFVKDLREAVDRVDPDVILYLNNSALRADQTGSNTRLLNDYVDIIGAEGGFFVANKTDSLYIPSAMAKELRCQGEGKPTVIFISSDNKPNSYYLHTAGETKRVFAQSVSNGANVWYGLHAMLSVKDTEGGIAAKEFLHYLKNNEEYYRNTSSAAKIALMFSSDTATFYASNVAASDFTGDGSEINTSMPRANHYTEFFGCYEMLAQGHIQFDVIDNVALTRDKGIDGYDLIILPCCACMSDEEAEALKNFVAAGGKVIATMENATYDEKGVRRAVQPLKEVFGWTHTDNFRTYEGLAYQEKPDGAPEQMPVYIPAPVFVSCVETDGAAVLGRRLKEMTGRYEPLEELGGPAILSSVYGKGEAITFTGNEGGYYYDWKDKNHLAMFCSYVRRLADPVTQAKAPKCVEVTLNRQGERYILHLINLAVDVSRPMENDLPVRDFSVTLLSRGKFTARTVSGEPLECRYEGENTEIFVKELIDYAAIVLERADR